MLDGDVGALALKKKSQEGDKDLSVVFYSEAIEDPEKSRDAGRPIFRDVPFVRIFVPGDATNIFTTEAWVDERDPNSHSRRFPEQWAAYQRGQASEAVEGTPLEKLPGIVKSQVMELRHFHVHTVEQLARLADGHVQKMMGAMELRQRARDWLAAAEGAEPLAAARAEIAKRDAEAAALREQMADMQAQVSQLVAAQAEAPRRGRPPKNTEA